ncbi:hypothetical protein ACHAWO_012111 [Cyclotella atomus]|uniref:Uncharacterized protein n=1 Tax=Cyclotella atomus TaxID=382360 RepID=A0ABD3NSF7_9STRA
MSIENKLRAYLATLDGSFRDFSSVEHLFEDLYHSGFVLQENENILDRKQMKQFHAKAFEMGSRATLLLRVTSQDSIEYKFRLTNNHWNIVIHCAAEVKDGKLYKAQPVDGSYPLLFRNIIIIT